MKAQIGNGCVVCNEVITNPICPDCLAERMQAWLAETNPKLAKDIRGYHLDGDTKCIFCNKTYQEKKKKVNLSFHTL